jgi:1-hydroxycarotenoid 3,4-desaturase
MPGSPTKNERVAIVGAGIGGLIAAIECATRGLRVTVFEQQSRPGGKARTVEVAGSAQDAGPTVFTMREVFDETFSLANKDLDSYVDLLPTDLLARHFWPSGDRLDLFADPALSRDAIGQFASRTDARGFDRFCKDAANLFDTLEPTFMRAARPTVASLTSRLIQTHPGGLFGMNPFSTLWRGLNKYFRDPRLLQLFGRYATYCGSSPFQAPAILMLIAHAEARGVWQIRGGMYELVRALVNLGEQLDVEYRFDSEVKTILTADNGIRAIELQDGEQIACKFAIYNGDANALADGRFGATATRAVQSVAVHDRSLSAMTWNLSVQTSGPELSHHNVFFSEDYQAEFEQIFRRMRVPDEPTVYACAMDRTGFDTRSSKQERLFLLVNAPPNGDSFDYTNELIEQVQGQVLSHIQRCGVSVELDSSDPVVTTPTEFSRRFPGTGGALYGRATHGWRSSFVRPGAHTPIRGLYLAGGSVHPGAGLPMAAISGQLAARQLISDLQPT